MNHSTNIQEELARFDGVAPLFPLPTVCLFPHVMLPLHIFEPRYRQLTEDALKSNGLVAMAVLRPDWEPFYDTKEVEIHSTVCLGKIVASKQLESGRYNLIVQGLARAQVIDEMENDSLYRAGELELCEDYYPVSPLVEWEERRRDLLLNFRNLFPNVELGHIFHQAIDADVSMGVLCDILASSLRLPHETALQLFGELDVETRSNIVLEAIVSKLDLETASTTADEFPPPFSLN